MFGERLFAFGRFGPDAYEQPFHSLDFTYFWYPTDRMTVKLKAQNLLATVQKYPSFPIVMETYRHAMADVFDLPAFKTLLKDIDAILASINQERKPC